MFAGVVVDEAFAYWANNVSGGAQTQFERVPVDGGTPTVLATENPLTDLIAVDATDVYWATRSLGDGDNCIMKVSKQGGHPMRVACYRDEPFGLALDAEYVYWTSNNSRGSHGGSDPAGAILKASKNGNGGPPTILAMEQAQPGAIAVDDASVYWSTRMIGGDSSLLKVSKNGGTPVVLTSGQAAYVLSIAVDETSLYWANTAHPETPAQPFSGAIMKLTPK